MPPLPKTSQLFSNQTNIQQEYIIAARLSAHTKVEKVTNSFKNSGNTTYIQTEQPRETPKFEL